LSKNVRKPQAAGEIFFDSHCISFTRTVVAQFSLAVTVQEKIQRIIFAFGVLYCFILRCLLA